MSVDGIDDVKCCLKVMGYDLLNDGIGIAALSIASGYNAVETASYIAIASLAEDIKRSKSNMEDLLKQMIHGAMLIEVLNDYKDKRLIHPSQWQNDVNALRGLATLDEQQLEWVKIILDDEMIAGKKLASICL